MSLVQQLRDLLISADTIPITKKFELVSPEVRSGEQKLSARTDFTAIH